MWEPRKWALLDRWGNCLKYEATGLHFSSGVLGWLGFGRGEARICGHSEVM